MHADTIETIETNRTAEATEATTEWTTPDFTEQSACAEICAYVFTA